MPGQASMRLARSVLGRLHPPYCICILPRTLHRPYASGKLQFASVPHFKSSGFSHSYSYSTRTKADIRSFYILCAQVITRRVLLLERHHRTSTASDATRPTTLQLLCTSPTRPCSHGPRRACWPVIDNVASLVLNPKTLPAVARHFTRHEGFSLAEPCQSC